MKNSAKMLTILVQAFVLSILVGCVQEKTLQQEYDVVILSGRVIDPETNLDATRNVGIKEGTISIITEKAIKGKETIDASGLIVAPGFIDPHSHGVELPAYRMQAFDGVTTAQTFGRDSLADNPRRSVDRMKALGVMQSFFAAHTFYWGDWHRESLLGPERAANISPTGWALKRGMMFTTHADAPVIPPDALRILWATVNRVTRTGQILGPDQRVSAEVALKAITIWATWQYFEENRKGSLEPGKLADMVVLSDDPVKVDPMKIADIRVLQTIKEGVVIYKGNKK